MPLAIDSTAFAAGAEIPARHTCEGEDLSPTLRFSGVPAAARALALVVDDPDAPDPAAPRTVWSHWILYDLPPATPGLPEGVPPDALPPGTREGLNDSKRTGYGGPCPPIGRHRYFFTLYALDAPLGDLGRPTRARVLEAIRGHVLEQAQLMGTYQKRGR
ncbi:PEBP family protein [Anaeromyxobacter dehalogenans 2CP-1]|uniref:PEBP family protein n=1 Tax=Anaeromyxobacter dehalogenans (strain ATCC BAA-258 / DSM 21875 / 2CP-1) TaxID=455488 RepID=B8JDR4_ANAD2|nr:YbhB/YbcL family Raf kinase inhibitor-like protein [Anaeromyxobacter dehalogenans]ACL64159.1 PEBP family protein [Anaeromyxobacter dehalogenans 2CP-1]